MRELSASEAAALAETAAALGVEPAWLAALVDFETAGTWSPAISNPHSSARGLLQFIDSTARDLGYADSDDLVRQHPTIEAQLRGPVLAYLSRWKPFPTLSALAMAVFYPAARYWSETAIFPRAVRDVNPGISTVGDYVRRVADRLDAARSALAGFLGSSGPALAGVALVGLALVLAGSLR